MIYRLTDINESCFASISSGKQLPKQGSVTGKGNPFGVGLSSGVRNMASSVGASGDVTQGVPSAAGASSGDGEIPPPPPPPSPPPHRSQEKGLEMWKRQQEKFTNPEERKVDVTDREDEGGKAAGTSFSPQGSSTSDDTEHVPTSTSDDTEHVPTSTSGDTEHVLSSTSCESEHVTSCESEHHFLSNMRSLY